VNRVAKIHEGWKLPNLTISRDQDRILRLSVGLRKGRPVVWEIPRPESTLGMSKVIRVDGRRQTIVVYFLSIHSSEHFSDVIHFGGWCGVLINHLLEYTGMGDPGMMTPIANECDETQLSILRQFSRLRNLMARNN
jgi:hypothetical protein